jgi:hypothetical protein
VGRAEIPAKKWNSKSSFPVPGKTRGVLNNPNNLVKVRGSGVKVRFFWRSYGKSAQPKSGQSDFCDELHNYKTIKLCSETL